MPTNALIEAKTIINEIRNADSGAYGKNRLLYVNKLRHRKIMNRKAVWAVRNADSGLSPLVSPAQNTPSVEQGTYRLLEAGPIITRHLKYFTAQELQDLISPDPAYRIDAKQHLVEELLDSERRIWDTMEFCACQALVKGAIRYILNDAIGRMDVNISFPVKTYTVSSTWSNTSTDIVADMDSYIKAYINRAGKRPDTIRMTTDVWEKIKNNTAVKNVFSTYIRTTGVNVREIPVGMISREIVARALDWPQIEIYDERTFVKYPALNNESAGANVVIELKGGTWGISVGDTVLVDYKVSSSGYDDWDSEAVVTSVNPGVSITVGTLSTGITAGEYIAVKPTFFPSQYVQFISDEEEENEFILPPFGIEYTGSEISANNWWGPRMDIFNFGGEPGMRVARRNWHEFGMRIGNPNKVMSVKVIL